MFHFVVDDKSIIPKQKNLKYVNFKRDKDILYHRKILNNTNIIINDKDQYIISNQLDKGGASEVYLGKNIETNEDIIIKKLDTKTIEKIFREVNILEICKDIPNTIKMLDIYQRDDIYYLIFPYYNCENTRRVFDTFDENDTKIFMKLFLETIAEIHDRGIIHRDIKPGNILVKSPKEFYIIDFGISDFYLPLRKFASTIGTKTFRSPEQLFGIKQFDYKVDIWATGLIFAELIFKKGSIFRARKCDTDDDILKQFAYYFGKEKLLDMKKKYKIKSDIKFVDDYNDIFMDIDDEDQKNLLMKLLEIDPQKRITAKNALEHSYFSGI